MSYSKIALEDVPLRTRSADEPGVRMAGYELAADEPRPTRMRFNYFVYETGDSTRRHTQVEQEETFFVVEGTGRLVVGDDAIPLAAGDVVVVDPGPWRHVEAETPMEIFAVGAPNVSDDHVFLDEVEDASNLPPGVPSP